MPAKKIMTIVISHNFHVFVPLNYSLSVPLIFRHILASLHFNENVKRDTQVPKKGERYRVTYPKFKLGEEVVREVSSPPTYGQYSAHPVQRDFTFSFQQMCFIDSIFLSLPKIAQLKVHPLEIKYCLVHAS